MPRSIENSKNPRRVGVREFRGNLNAFLKDVEAGQILVLTSHHKVVAEIHPPSQPILERKPGAQRGRIKMAEDFDVMQESELSVMESEV
jgi:antitoxin (DNA-binding transcriptional repressor) of toxin-antitoxin stability system